MTDTPVAPARPVVLIAEELSPATVEALGPDFEVRYCNGADPAELVEAIADVDAILVRSATKVDADALGCRQAAQGRRPRRRRVSTTSTSGKPPSAGVMVVNAPTSNIVSAAELAVGLLLAAARHIAPASQALRGGEWKRSKYTGTELYEKTLGIVGLGRIGVLVAQRLSAFGMRVVAYDPYVQAGRAAQLGVRLVTLDDLVAESDFISVHLPKTDDEVAPYRYGPPVSPTWAPSSRASESTRRGCAGRRGRRRGCGLLVCEGVGGLLVPLTPATWSATCPRARTAGGVAATPGLGTINHTLLTLEAARAAGSRCRWSCSPPGPTPDHLRALQPRGDRACGQVEVERCRGSTSSSRSAGRL